jgi:uracil-DNA glycosylase family 4
VRCAPPANKPLPEEVERCLPHLANEIAQLPRLQLVVALGKIAWDAWLKLLVSRGEELPRPRPAFEHGKKWTRDGLTLFGVYHPSRQNTNTGVLTAQMYDAVFSDIRRCLR